MSEPIEISREECPPKAVVIGASSGIGRGLSKTLAEAGYVVGLTARRTELLNSLQGEIPSKTFVRVIDLHNIPVSVQWVDELVRDMGGLDLMVINAGINHCDDELSWAGEYETVQINAVAFMALADWAFHYFRRQNSGHLVGISSIAGLRGSGLKPAYAASKAFVSNYLAGLRQRLSHTPVCVTDIRPGYVDTAILQNKSHVFWMASCEKAAGQIYGAIRRKRKVAYITKRWGMAALAYRFVPDALYDWFYRNVLAREVRSCHEGKG